MSKQELEFRFAAGVRRDPNWATNLDLNSEIIPMNFLTPKACLEIYQKAYVARLTEALGETFETVWWILGDEAFFEICRKFVNAQPSRYYDLSDYGLEFPAFLSRLNLEFPFLSELALFEWEFKEIFHRPSIFTKSIKYLSQLAPNEAFRLHPHVKRLQFQFDVYELWSKRGLDEIPEWRKPGSWLMYNFENRIMIHRLSDIEKTFFKLLDRDEMSLEEALERLGKENSNINESQVTNLFSSIANWPIYEQSVLRQ